MYCPNCGSEIQPGTRFCPHCGADVSAANAEQADQTPQQPTGPSQPNGVPQQPFGAQQQNPYGTQPQQPYGTQPQQPYGAPTNVPQGNGMQQPSGKGSGGKGTGKIIAIAAIVIVAVVAIGLFAFGAFSDDESDNGTEETTSQSSTTDKDAESDEEDATSAESSTSSSASDAEPLSSEWLKDNFSEVWYGDTQNGTACIYTNPDVTYVLVEFFDSDGSVSSYYYGDASYTVYDDNTVEVDIDVEQGDDVHFNYTLDGATMVLLDDNGYEAGRMEKQDFDSFVSQHS
jgi:hypothetical protein